MGAVTLGMAVDTVHRAYRLVTPVPWGDRATAAMEFGQKSGWDFLWSPSNEHIIFFPRILYWIDSAWFDMSDFSLVSLNLLLSMGIALGYVYIARRLFFASRLHTLLYAFLIVAMYFNLTHTYTYTMGYMVQHWIVNSTLLAFAYLHSGLAEPMTAWRAATRCLVLAGLAVVAIFSSGSGALCLPVAIVVAVMFGFRWRFVACWAVLATLLVVAATTINPDSGQALKLSVLTASPVDSLKFYLAFLGAPYFRFHTWPADVPFWTWEGWKACILGLVVLAFGCGLIVHELWNRRSATRFSLTHIYMILLVFGIGILACAARLHLGVYEGANPKYACTSLLAWLSILSLAIKVLAQYGVLSRVHALTAWVGTFLGIVVLLVIPAHLRESRAMRDWVSHLWEGSSMMFAGVYDPALRLHHYPEDLFRFSQNYMRPHRLGPFHYYPFQLGDRLADHFTVDAAYPLKGEFDVKELIQTPIGKGLRVQGWAWDEGRHRPAPTLLFVDTAGRIVGVAHTGRTRPDVAAKLDIPQHLRCGFLGGARADDAAQPITAYAIVGPDTVARVGTR
jgi:hypothetical protein